MSAQSAPLSNCAVSNVLSRHQGINLEPLLCCTKCFWPHADCLNHGRVASTSSAASKDAHEPEDEELDVELAGGFSSLFLSGRGLLVKVLQDSFSGRRMQANVMPGIMHRLGRLDHGLVYRGQDLRLDRRSRRNLVPRVMLGHANQPPCLV